MRQSLESVINRTLNPDEIVLVKGCLLTVELASIINEYEENYSENFQVIALPENKRLANSLNVVIQKAQYALIAQMDSDDIYFKDRLKKQVKYVTTENLDIIGGKIVEFGICI